MWDDKWCHEDHPDNKASHTSAVIKILQQIQCTERNAICLLGFRVHISLMNGNVYWSFKRKPCGRPRYPWQTKSALYRKPKPKSNAKEFIRDINAGKIRVIMGSTEKLGTG